MVGSDALPRTQDQQHVEQIDATSRPRPELPDLGFRIGQRVIPTRYCLAPLAGYTQHPLRLALRELGGLGLATTDLVHATHLLTGHRESVELIATSAADRPLSVQIFGSRPDQLAAAAQHLVDRGYEGIDLNMGCPMAKVNGAGGGARLMCDVDGASRLVATVVAAVACPVTVKMRLGWEVDQLTAPALARRFEQLGVAAITVHGRYRAQGFHGTVDLDGISATVAAVQQIPVIGNGDVRTVADAEQMRAITGCHAVAIGRGAMLDPWIFRKLDDQAHGRPSREPSALEQIAFLKRHFELMLEQHDVRGCLLFRKFAAWYGARLGIPEDLEQRLRTLASPDEFSGLCAEIAERHGQRREVTPTALVRIPNGPIAHW
jgi:tRNA-dihydrouridine synthase B